MSKKQRKIISIDIELEDFEPIHLKMDEAKELYEQLHDLFGDKQKDVQHHYYPWYQQPYYHWPHGTVLCGSSTVQATLTDAVSTTITDSAFNNIVDNMQVTSKATGMTVSYNSA